MIIPTVWPKAQFFLTLIGEFVKKEKCNEISQSDLNRIIKKNHGPPPFHPKGLLRAPPAGFHSISKLRDPDSGESDSRSVQSESEILAERESRAECRAESESGLFEG